MHGENLGCTCRRAAAVRSTGWNLDNVSDLITLLWLALDLQEDFTLKDVGILRTGMGVAIEAGVGWNQGISHHRLVTGRKIICTKGCSSDALLSYRARQEGG